MIAEVAVSRTDKGWRARIWARPDGRKKVVMKSPELTKDGMRKWITDSMASLEASREPAG